MRQGALPPFPLRTGTRLRAPRERRGAPRPRLRPSSRRPADGAALAASGAPSAVAAALPASDGAAGGSGAAPAEAPRTTVVVVHASVGSGHRSAANAVSQALELLRDTPDASLRAGVEVPADLDVEVLDILDFGRIRFDGDKTASMFTGATRPVYDLTWRYTFTGRLLWGAAPCGRA